MKARLDFPFIFIILSLLLQSAAFGIGKQAALTIEKFSVFAALTNSFYLASLICLVFHALVWQVVLRKYSLSFAYFFMSGIFVNILIISHFIFHEHISLGNMAGAVVITVGIIFLSRGDGLETDV